MSLVQTVIATPGTGNLSATFSTPTKPGNLVLVFIGCTTNGDTVATPTDDALNIYHVGYSSSVNSNLRCYFANNASPVSTITATFVGSVSTHSLIIREYNAVNFCQAVLDVTNTGFGSGVSPATNATGFTHYPNILVVSSCVAVGTSAVLTAGAGYANVATDNFGGTASMHAVEDQIVSSIAQQTGAMTSSDAGSAWDIGVATFVLRTDYTPSMIRPIGVIGMSAGVPSN